MIGTFTPRVSGARYDVPLDIAAVEAWAGRNGNYGMALYGVDDMNQGAWLVTRNNDNVAARPCLTVTYVEPPADPS